MGGVSAENEVHQLTSMQRYAIRKGIRDALARRGAGRILRHHVLHPDRERSPYNFVGPHEPHGFSSTWAHPGDIYPDENRTSLTINDDARADEIKEETRLYTAFRRYIEASPVYEPFARPFTTTHGRMQLFHRTPATRLAIGLL